MGHGRTPALYWNTVRYLKPCQILYRLTGGRCSLGTRPGELNGRPRAILSPPELDYDPAFLARFSPEEFLSDKVTFLYQTETFCWEEPWERPGRTPLWNFNLHYFEYLPSLVHACLETGEAACFQKVLSCMDAWIRWNPRRGGGPGWSPYTVSLRLTYWLSAYSALETELPQEFRRRLAASIHEQYVFLAGHLERRLLGNHLFENLKALVLCALFFEDEPVLERALAALRRLCREEIFPDGVHGERSPMYQKLVLEALLRVTAALRGAGRRDAELERNVKRMLNAAETLERGLDRMPLFGDCGCNAAKSLTALRRAAWTHLRLRPEVRESLPWGGYYRLSQGDWQLAVNGGAPGASHLTGHTHCDAMSFELFFRGRPVLVNCGTYGYQCPQRAFFRSAAAHNTVLADGAEQSQCWGVFRLAKRSHVRVLSLDGGEIRMEMTDQRGVKVRRTLALRGGMLHIEDRAEGHTLTCFLHGNGLNRAVKTTAQVRFLRQSYAPELGRQGEIEAAELTGRDAVAVRLCLGAMLGGEVRENGLDSGV